MHWGKISGGRVSNLIAERVELQGSFRFSDLKMRAEMPARIERLVKGICDSFGATYEIQIGPRPMRAVVSTPHEAALMRAALLEVLGPERTIDMRHPRLAADTMDHWLNRRPGVFYMVGTAGKDESTHWPSHHQKFDIAPETWPAAVAGIAMTVIRYLEQAKPWTGK
jgi:metal-dependent amidase/aminoacylase/carboxypeptidase family protein